MTYSKVLINTKVIKLMYIATFLAISVFSTPNANLPVKAETVSQVPSKFSSWIVIGKTLTGDTLSLDISSAHFVGYGEATEFTYKFTDKVTSRVNKAITESCDPKIGELDKNVSPEWFVTNQNGKKTRILVKAESQASKQMLERVCYQGHVLFKKYGIQN